MLKQNSKQGWTAVLPVARRLLPNGGVKKKMSDAQMEQPGRHMEGGMKENQEKLPGLSGTSQKDGWGSRRCFWS